MPSELALLNNYLLVGAMLFGIGLIGFLSRRNIIVMFLAAELMLQGVALSLAAWSRFHNNFGGQVMVVFIIAVAACEAAIALALVRVLFAQTGKLDVAIWHRLREENLPPWPDQLPPEEPPSSPAWPRLVPAGLQPDALPPETDYRSHV